MLLVPTNGITLGSLLTLGNQLRPVSTDEIRQAICPANDELSPVKRSVKKLQESGLLPKHGDAIITCPSNADQICLNLKDVEAPSESKLFHQTMNNQTTPFCTFQFQL